jgi:hypothetical protein
MWTKGEDERSSGPTVYIQTSYQFIFNFVYLLLVKGLHHWDAADE